MHRLLVTVFVSISCMCAAYAEDLWATAVAERPTDGWKIIHRYIERLEVPAEKLAYPIAVTFTWKYNGPNGLPVKADTDSIYKLEDILDERMEKLGEGKLALVATGNNLRTWIYYVKSEARFRKELADASAAVNLRVDVSSKADPQWIRLENFKRGVRKS